MDLQRVLARLEADSALFEAKQLRRRLEALDALDAHAHRLDEQARALRTRLEVTNAAIYQSIRREVQQGAPPRELLRWIDACRSGGEPLQPGLSYDLLDELISGVLQLGEPSSAEIDPGPERVFYQPTPVRHILRLMEVCALSQDDVFLDLGSGLGHVPILVSILTGARSIGVEVEAAYVASARECARRLGLSRAAFVQQDASEADLSAGTVFYLYTPFTGTLLMTVLRRLRQQSEDRAIRVCTLGPCTAVLAGEPWLGASAQPDPHRITCFLSRN